MTATVTVRLADGTGRPAPLHLAGSGWFYACPWCQAPVSSPEAWQEHERANAEACARRGEDYQPVPCPSSVAEAWGARGCPDPACLANMPAARLADALRRREEEEARQREREDRDRRVREYAETRGQRHQQDDALWARTQADAGTSGGPARRGDLIVVRQHHPGYGSGVPSDSYTVGVVTSVARDGTVKAYQPAGDFPEPDWQGKVSKGTDLARSRPDRTWTLSARDVDVPGALATAACHTWPRDECMTRPFDSMADVHAALQPHLKPGQPGTQALSAAAGQWEQARRQARELRPPMSAPREEFLQAHAAYAAAVGAANEAYRQAASAAGQDPGDPPAAGGGSGRAPRGRQPGGVAAAWNQMVAATGGFEPETDAHLTGWMAGEAAGMAAYAEAIGDVYETAVNTVGLDPASMQALHEYAAAAATAARAMAAARARFTAHYQAAREFTAAGGVLPHDGRWMTGEGD